jgi:AcrR family transcriptional regulator
MTPPTPPETGPRARRRYRGTAQAAVATLTHQRILAAALALAAEEWLDRITLEQVAARADVTVQTVIRHFGTKEGLFTAAAEDASLRALHRRGETPVGHVPAAIALLMDHYEEVGDRLVRLLAQEDSFPGLRAFTDAGRHAHREWVARTFAPFLTRRDGQERDRLVAQLVAVTDVTVWKLMRRDLGQDRQQTELALRELLRALLEREKTSAKGTAGDAEKESEL